MFPPTPDELKLEPQTSANSETSAWEGGTSLVLKESSQGEGSKLASLEKVGTL